MKRIVLTGGGTAGHVYPLLAVKEKMNNSEYKFYYIGGNGMEKDIIKKEKDINYFQIPTVKFERKITFKNFLIPIKLLKSINEAKRALKKIKPNVVFSKGGFVAVPVVIAAKKLGIAVVSHESDLSMGLANKVILHYCDKMCTSFESTAHENKKVVFTGQPIRKKVLNGDKRNLNFYTKLDKSKKTILIVGGSSGAKFLNEKILKNIDKLCKKYNCVHITGKQDCEKNTHKDYFQVEYAENIGDYLDLADIVVSRAGSGAINEFLTLKKPMLLIPLSKKCSRGDQIENAKLFTKLGYSDMITEEDFEDEIFLAKLEKILRNEKKYIKNMEKYPPINASEKIVEIIKEIEK